MVKKFKLALIHIISKLDLLDIIGLTGVVVAGCHLWPLGPEHHIFWTSVGLLLGLIGIFAGGVRK